MQTGTEKSTIPLAGVELLPILAALVDAAEFDEHIGALQELRILADAGAALAMRQGEHLSHNDCAVLFSTIALRCERASEALDKSIAYLVQLGTAQQGALQ
ncbi:MAG: hypothetical protein Q8R33_00405 [Burkholderiales bacterium]|nr:hypothetical protein [Burkholderiales bacterium]